MKQKRKKMAESKSSFWSVLENNQKAAYIYFGGVAASIIIHTTFRGIEHWQKAVTQKKRGIEPDTNTTSGIKRGFVQGLVRGWLWPLHVFTGVSSTVIKMFEFDTKTE